MSNDNSKAHVSSLAVTAMLFGLLSLASHGNELLKQFVISPESIASTDIAADCRSDELIEEGLSLAECQLMLSNVRMTLASSHDWFRPIQLTLSGLGLAMALLSLIAAFGLINSSTPSYALLFVSTATLLLVDIAGVFNALNTGPLLRAQYLWPLTLWVCVHLSLAIAALRFRLQASGAQP